MLEFDTTDNKFRDNLVTGMPSIQEQVKTNGGRARVPTAPGLGVEPDRDVIRHYAIG